MTKVKELIKDLKTINPESEVLISSDEELNALFKDFQISELSDRKNTIVIYGLSGSQLN